MLKRTLFALLIVAILSLPALTACDSGTAAPTATPEPAPTTPTPTPAPAPEPGPTPTETPAAGLTEMEQLLADSLLALQNVKSYKAEIDMDVTTDITGGENPVRISVTMTAESVFDLAANDLHMSMEMDGGDAAQAMQNVTMDIYMVGGWMYLKMDIPMLGEQWVKMPVSEQLKESYDLNMVDKHFALLQSPAEIELTGMETVDGVNCYALKITPDMPTLLKWAQQQSAGNTATDWEKADQVADSIQDLAFVVWIAEDSQLVRKMDIDMTMETTGEQVSPESPAFDKMITDIEMTMRLYDYNEPVSIVLPAAAQNAREMPMQNP
jgi:hypothetical protein